MEEHPLQSNNNQQLEPNDIEPDVFLDFHTILTQEHQDYINSLDSKSGIKMEAKNEQGYYIEQYVFGVLDFSSQYGIDYSISYTAANIIGRPNKFPAYGDYPETFTMRTYGDWWQRAPSATREIQPQNSLAVPTQDYIVVYFEEFVIPTEVVIFETYNPGAVVRIWAHNISKRWVLLFEASKISCSMPSFRAREARRFSPQLKKTPVITKTLRIDFNHSRLNYYTEIDAIMLCGRTVSLNTIKNHLKEEHMSTENGLISCALRSMNFKPSCNHNFELTLNDFLNNDLSKFITDSSPEQSHSSVSLNDLPLEILFKIVGYLDLKSLFVVGQVSRKLYDVSTHPLLYCELNLKTYWSTADSELLGTLARRASLLRKLDMSWCGGFGEFSSTDFKKFLTQRGDSLTHLRLNSCKFLNSSCIETVGIVCDNLIELSLRNCTTDPPLLNFSCLANLKNLERLDLFQTAFESELLLSMLEGNRKLKHLNLAFCGVSVNMDNVAAHLGTYNTQLISLDMWKAHFLSARGLHSLSKCTQLEEIDMGWCLREASIGDGLLKLLASCPKLKKLFLSAVRGVTERDLINIATLGVNLEQLDLMGILNITRERVYDILEGCRNLQLLDISFCDSILDRDYELLAEWARLYKVDIKNSSVPYEAR